ncbi:hypothetical protein SLK22_15855, partial [Acinetobacter pittii]|nr:hypothetical protein [Acinetobacter pittii]
LVQLKRWLLHKYLKIRQLYLSSICATKPISAEARSRINSIYMTLYFGGAALGSFIAVYAWKHWGWEACATLGLGLAMLSFMIDRLDFYEMNKIAKQEKAP